MAELPVIALGGGHGLYSSLSALRAVSSDLTAIVTVADDGGSSGRLRSELGILAPGDLRMALSALCEDTEWGRTWRDVLQSRFESDGPLAGHAVGNLLIAALWNHTGDVVQGLEWVARLLRAEGKVLPLAIDPLTISAQVTDGARTWSVDGQVAVATAPGHIERVWITPSQPRVPAETVQAIDDAAVVVLGPGSWYTSVLTHFLVEPVAQALVRAAARSVVILNIDHEDEETAGTQRVDDIRALRALAPQFVPAVVLADANHGEEELLAEEVSNWGATLVVADLADPNATARHDISALRVQLTEVSHKVTGV